MVVDELADAAGQARVDAFIAEWAPSGAAERANFQSFVIALCVLLGLQPPRPAHADNNLNDYVFERPVTFRHADGSTSPGFIDLYKRGCFVMEGKQGNRRSGLDTAGGRQLELQVSSIAGGQRTGAARRGTRGWDCLMLNARRQAEGYAKALPRDHGWPPFLVVIDVGHVIELYADFSGQGKNYAQFPDRRDFRIPLDGLRDDGIRDRLRKLWRAPHDLDPARLSAEVTHDVAERLARVARRLERRGSDAGAVAEFLMRCLFSMFAEDAGLLPNRAFADILQQARTRPDLFPHAVTELWRAMDTGGYAGIVGDMIRRFNGGLFHDPAVLDLVAEEIGELAAAADRDWRDVEPAIFGTLLERALERGDRHRLGAHYTPRAYVERLVVPTVIEPLTEDWRNVQAEAEQWLKDRRPLEARRCVRDYHRRLCEIRVLDPACGTGNFLYVAMELMKRLEGEVLDYLGHLGEDQYTLELSGHTVDPHQFLGLEINPRAVQIADLVLWIGFIKWQLRTGGQRGIDEPVLRAFGNIREQDAIIEWDERLPSLDAAGIQRTRWNGTTFRRHPVTGDDVPDGTATVPIWTYRNPRVARWPDCDFIVGNPPFIAGQGMRQDLGDGYAEACWTARPHISGGADFVMHFWDHAASLLRAGHVRRFGFISTNSITQNFSRRVIEHHMEGPHPLSIVYAIGDHPWLRSAGRAAVRIAMTVGVPGRHRPGRLYTVTAESGLDTDQPEVALSVRAGVIRSTLTTGADLSSLSPLLSNSGLAHMGVKLHGAGFLLTRGQAIALGYNNSSIRNRIIRPFVNGRDIAQISRNKFAIDLFGFEEGVARLNFPGIYQYLLLTVKPEREQNNRVSYRENWWIWGEPRREWRKASRGLPRYIATVRTAKHRYFRFVSSATCAESSLVTIASDSGALLAMLNSRHHIQFAAKTGGHLGVGNDPTYNHSTCFSPFPFPLLSNRQQRHLAALGERLDQLRGERQAAHQDLTMTGLYNVLERLRQIDGSQNAPPLTAEERAIHDNGLVSVLRAIHDDIDQAMAAAYGWPADLPDAEILSRLVALNIERAGQEGQGEVHWLRPEYQLPALVSDVPRTAQISAVMDLPIGAPPPWPSHLPDQIRLVRDALNRHGGPMSVDDLSSAFRGGRHRQRRLAEMLDMMAITGLVRGDGDRFFLVS